MRTYNVRTVALALDVTPKWLDNLLSHFRVPGVHRSRQGVERLIDDAGLLACEIVRALNIELGVPLGRSVDVAARARESSDGTVATVRTESGLVISIPVASIEARLRDRVVDAVEAVGHLRRGRPPRKRSA